MSSAAELEHLEDAPIDEVACGVLFNPIADLDPLVIGAYWHERVGDYPGHTIRTPLRNPVVLMDLVGSVPPLRAMLVSKGDDLVIQVQPDRFYLNWRRRHGVYPRFNKRAENEGVLGIALREYGEFEKFCERVIKTKPVTTGIELAKIDVIREGDYWTELQQVADILPCTHDFIRFTASSKPSFMLRFNEPRERGVVLINIALGADREGTRMLTIETRLHRQLDGADIEATFKEANLELNAIFATLIPKEQRARYFNKGRS